MKTSTRVQKLSNWDIDFAAKILKKRNSSLFRMIDWLSWPLAQHVETWVIALLKGLAAVQKFTILIDVTLLKIELVSITIQRLLEF